MSSRTVGEDIVEVYDLPVNPKLNTVYRLGPKNPDLTYYRERTDRNIGWITRGEQEMLQSMTVGIAGCGGMGGLLAQIFLRLGIGEVRIADNEVFDVSNINRQFAATRSTVGVSKALATARMLRATTDDNTLVVYPQGISEETVESFVSGCDVICDEIEFWAIGARILLHQYARVAKVSVFNCNTIGFGTRLFLFSPTGPNIEDLLGLSINKAFDLQNKIQKKQATSEEIDFVMSRVIGSLAPNLPSYHPKESDLKAVQKRLHEEQKASIISTNPPMATGFLADWVLIYLLRKSGVKISTGELPKAPEYLYFDIVGTTERRGGLS